MQIKNKGLLCLTFLTYFYCMKKVLIPFILLCFVGLLYYGNVITVNAAQIHLKDVDVKVIYLYEDDYEFVGYHERSMTHLEEGNLGFKVNYDPLYQEIFEGERGRNYVINFGDTIVQAPSGTKDYLDICIDMKDLNIKKEKIKFLNDKVTFKFNSALDAYSYLWNRETQRWFEREQFTRHDRDFKVEGHFEISGIYDDAFIEYQIKRLILYKLKYTALDYLYGYHGHDGIRNHFVGMARYFDGMIRSTMGLPHTGYQYVSQLEKDRDAHEAREEAAANENEIAKSQSENSTL